MRQTVATWNMQGANGKAAVLDDLLNKASVVMLQEAGVYACGGGYNGYWCGGALGDATDGYANNRVSLAIISHTAPAHTGFEFAEDRGLYYAMINGVLYGTWHEKRGNGGLALCIGRLLFNHTITPDTPCIIGGDFNDRTWQPIAVGSSRRCGLTLESSSYNLAYSGTQTHPGSGNNLDRVFVSRPLDMVHQWCIDVPRSDHNPVLATIVDTAGSLTWWEAAKNLASGRIAPNPILGLY